ncbi:hypothetical protein SteCoe_33813 [Stentor coeruleus]|uniref:non-specific serine/threonine protein kinase n=1 Tax=Stentor coeruleus TaxID=5963 RepID=A0A1R2AW35_9CILI|nr:hypothetical protein SteCoe_33813 [Stentor coeruleus]
MGQSTSNQELRVQSEKPRRDTSKYNPYQNKIVKIIANHSIITIEIPDDSMTCGWLLSEVIRHYKNEGSIAALRTKESLDILDEYLLRFEKSLKPFSSYEMLTAYFSEDCDDVGIGRFNFLKNIGIGKYSKVVLSRKKDTGILYAIKILEKQEVEKNNRLEQVIAERNILAQISHPFIVKLHWACQSDSQFYYVLKYLPGGELGFHLKNIGRFTENQAKFYFGEILLALEYLHDRNIAFKNLKPESIMLDIDGHIKIIDFSQAKSSSPNPYLFSLNPEDQNNTESIIDKTEDFYKLGLLLYEVLNTTKLIEKPDNSLEISESIFPKYLSKDVKNLIIRLLSKDSLGKTNKNLEDTLKKPNGISFEEIKQHPWCQGINWQRMLKKKYTPPFRPNLKKSNFDPEIMKVPVNLDTFEGHEEENFNFSSESIEVCYWNMTEILLSDSNLPSERTSTDAEETFKALLHNKSIDITENTTKIYQEIQSFTLPSHNEIDEKKGNFKSLSPSERTNKVSSIRSLLKTVTGVHKYFAEDQRQHKNLESLSLHIPDLSSDVGKMQEAVRKKLILKDEN